MDKAARHQKYLVSDIVATPQEQSRLKDLGFIQGKEIFLDYKCSEKGPFIISVNDEYVALRENEAACIQVQGK